MTKLFSSLAACAFVVGLSLAGTASAEDAMKSDPIKKNNMQSSAMSKDGGTMSKDAMKSSKTDCMHKADMEKDAMKKADMMKACDAMK